MVSKRKLLFFVYLLSITLLFLEIQYLNLHHHFQWDLTKNKRYTLTEKTKEILRKTPGPMQVVILIPKSHPLFQQLLDLVEEMKKVQPKIQIQVLDLIQNPDQFEKFKQSYQHLGRETGLIISVQGRSKYFSLFDLQSQKTFFKGEELIASALYALSQPKKKTIYFLRGHGEPMISSFEPDGIGHLAKYLEANGYLLKNISLKKDTLPMDAPLVVVISPKREVPFEEDLQLARYFRHGGTLLLLLDPQSYIPMEETLEKLQIRLPRTQVEEPQLHLLRDPRYLAVQHFSNHPLVQDFKGFTLYWPGVRPVFKQREGEILIQSSSKSNVHPPLSGVPSQGPYGLGLYLKKKGRLVILGDSHFLRNGISKGSRPLWGLDCGANKDFAFSLISALAEKNKLIGLGRKPIRNPILQISEKEMKKIWWFTCIFLPGFVLLWGLAVWLWRKT